jgi:hypothetical protein
MGGTMTDVPPVSEAAAPPVQTTSAFSWVLWIVGMLVSLVVGGGLNIISGLAGGSTNSHPLALLIGAVPGVIFVAIGYALRRRTSGFGMGLIVGGAIIALIGGACGSSMVGLSFH